MLLPRRRGSSRQRPGARQESAGRVTRRPAGRARGCSGTARPRQDLIPRSHSDHPGLTTSSAGPRSVRTNTALVAPTADYALTADRRFVTAGQYRNPTLHVLRDEGRGRFTGWRPCCRAEGRLMIAAALRGPARPGRYGLRPTAMNPRTAEKKVSASAARSRAAHHAAASPALTWPACTARSIVPRLSCW
jgi:hypothetical protein